MVFSISEANVELQLRDLSVIERKLKKNESLLGLRNRKIVVWLKFEKKNRKLAVMMASSMNRTCAPTTISKWGMRNMKIILCNSKSNK